jgi:hypothetical protein
VEPFARRGDQGHSRSFRQLFVHFQSFLDHVVQE